MCASSIISPDITLYTWATANGVKASITLEELCLPYKTESIDIGTNIQKMEYDILGIHIRSRPANDDQKIGGS